MNQLATELGGCGKPGARDRRRVAGGGARRRAGHSRRHYARGEDMNAIRNDSGNGTVSSISWTCSTSAAAMTGSARVSASVGRARRLSVRVYPDARVEVVVPPRARPREVEQFLWRTSRMDRWQAGRGAAQRPAPEPFPPAAAAASRLTRETWRLHLARRRGRARTRAKCRAGRRRHPAVSVPARVARDARPCARWLLRAARDAARAAAGRARGRPPAVRYSPGVDPPAAFALGKLFGARYHQPQCLPAVPAPRSGGLPHRARAHARQAHEPLGALLAGGGEALRRTGARSIASCCRAGATCRAGSFHES